MTSTYWHLFFRQTRPTVFDGFELKSERILAEEYERALAAAVGGPVTTTPGAYVGNPRDFYSRELELTTTYDDRIQIELRIQQSAFAPDDPAPLLGANISVSLLAPPSAYAARLAIWHAIRDELAKIGCVDLTVDARPTEIVREATAAGDHDTATRLASAIAAATQEAERAERERVDKLRALEVIADQGSAAPPSAPVASPPAAPAAAAAPIASAPVRPVASRRESHVTFERGVLEVAYGATDAAALRSLIEGGAYRDATKVVLAGSPIGDDGVALLAWSGGFPSVTQLHLDATGITDTGARALARHAVGLDHLERIDLGEVPAEGSRIGARDDSGVSDAGVEELARSDRLPALRTIVRGKEYRFVPEGREEREIVEIRRADGRVVESWIYHSIWP